jgi:excisionase family DNA binding protein
MVTLNRKRLLTCAEVSYRLHCSVATISRLVKAGAIPHVRLCGGIRFDENQIEAWIASGGNQPKSRKGRPRMVGVVATRSEKDSKLLNSQIGDRFNEPVDAGNGAG